MTAREKFEARLEQLGLLDEWNSVGSCGRVAKFDDEFNINLLIHEGKGDQYTEIWYLPFDELREKDKDFVERCWDLVRETEDGEFARDLSLWLMKKTNKDCPLHPTDAYFLAEENEYYHTFEDDADDEKEEEEYQAKVKKYSEFCGWALSTLSYIRATLYDAVRMELARGHNLPDNYSVENGQDYFHDYSFCYVNKEEVVENKGILYVKCTENGSFFTIPFDSLHEKTILDIYESMK